MLHRHAHRSLLLQLLWGIRYALVERQDAHAPAVDIRLQPVRALPYDLGRHEARSAANASNLCPGAPPTPRPPPPPLPALPCPTMPSERARPGSVGHPVQPSHALPCPLRDSARLGGVRQGAALSPQRILSDEPLYLFGHAKVGKQEPLGTAGQKISARAALALVPPPTWPKGPGSGPPKPGLGPWSKSSRPI